MRILYITPYVPSRIRTRPRELILGLGRLGHQVTVVTASETGDATDVDALRGQGAVVEAFEVSQREALRNCLAALPSGDPLQARYAYHPAMMQRIAELTANRGFDVVHIEHLRAAHYVRSVGLRPVVFDSVDCISLLFEQTARSSPQVRTRLMALLDLARTRRYEARLMTQFDAVAVSSWRDRDALTALRQRYEPLSVHMAPITVISNGVDLDYFRPDPGHGERSSNTVIFTGKMSYHANVAGVLFFAREVLPKVWAVRPDVAFRVVGKDPPSIVQRLARDPRIEVSGHVEDLRPHLARAAVAVCPVPYAVGIQNKVLEAMAMGTPVVTMPGSSAALSAASGHDLLVAQDPKGLADAILQVLGDPSLAERLGAAGRKYVEQKHSWELSAQQLIAVYEKAIDGARTVGM